MAAASSFLGPVEVGHLRDGQDRTPAPRQATARFVVSP